MRTFGKTVGDVITAGNAATKHSRCAITTVPGLGLGLGLGFALGLGLRFALGLGLELRSRTISPRYPQGRVELIPSQGGGLELTVAHARPEQDVPCPLIRPGSVHNLFSDKALDSQLIHKATSLHRRGRPRGTGGGLAYRLWRVVRLRVGQGKGSRRHEEAEHRVCRADDIDWRTKLPGSHRE